MSLLRRRITMVLALLPAAWAASKVRIIDGYVVIDGWVMKRSDLDAKASTERR